MNSSDRMTLKLLDEMESEMDNYDGKQYAQMAQDKANPAPSPDPAPESESTKQPDKPFYTNPGKQKLLDEVEMQSSAEKPQFKYQFGKSKKA